MIDASKIKPGDTVTAEFVVGDITGTGILSDTPGVVQSFAKFSHIISHTPAKRELAIGVPVKRRSDDAARKVVWFDQLSVALAHTNDVRDFHLRPRDEFDREWEILP